MNTFRRMFLLLSSFVALAGSIKVQAEERPIAASADAAKPLQAGERLPDVSVQDASGAPVALQDLLAADGPLVIVFYRGSWCPLCTRHFQQLLKIQPELAQRNAKLVAISPDTPENSAANQKRLELPFPLLSDPDLKATRAFGLAFQVDDETVKKYTGFGIHLAKSADSGQYALPVPAVYLVDGEGEIRFAHSNPDYSQRLDPAAILQEIDKLR